MVANHLSTVAGADPELDLTVRPAPAGLGSLATAWVDLDAIAANVRVLAEAARGASLMAVKADAFGHGAVPVARTALASGASWLGVARIEEAMALREAHLEALILAWLLEPRLVPAALARGIDVSASSTADLEGIARAAETAGRRARVHLKLDTGLHRSGAPPSAWLAVLRHAVRLKSTRLLRVVGIWSHLSHGDVVGHPEIARQRARFADGLAAARRIGIRPEVTHLANTGALLQFGAAGGTLVRVGAGMYGIDVFRRALGACPLRPALTLTTRVVAVRDISAVEGVGYGHEWVAERPTRLALVPLGYADGLPRGAVGDCVSGPRSHTGRHGTRASTGDSRRVTPTTANPPALDPFCSRTPGLWGSRSSSATRTWSGSHPQFAFRSRTPSRCHPPTASHGPRGASTTCSAAMSRADSRGPRPHCRTTCGLHLVEGYRPPEVQAALYEAHRRRLLGDLPGIDVAESHRLASRFVARPAVAAYPSGAAVDVTLFDAGGQPLDMGTGSTRRPRTAAAPATWTRPASPRLRARTVGCWQRRCEPRAS